MNQNKYFHQVDLLLEVLPHVMEQDCFGLKGGTALNLFIRDLPRYSVDIDLTYLPVEDRSSSIEKIKSALIAIENKLKKILPQANVFIRQNHKMIVNTRKAEIKIEPNLIVRGTVFPCTEMELCQKAQAEFGKFVRGHCLSKADLYGSKICAALDRQHPRDLFDIKLLFENEGITDEIKQTFLVYLISYPRPMHELLRPNLLDQRAVFQSDFEDMTTYQITYENLENVRKDLIEKINNSLTKSDKDFLISVKQGTPQWELLGLNNIENLPAVQWKLKNIQKMDQSKHKSTLEKLKEVLNN